LACERNRDGFSGECGTPDGCSHVALKNGVIGEYRGDAEFCRAERCGAQSCAEKQCGEV
jgi:hypothetical protein